MTRKYYRADRRPFEPQEIMPPEGTYQNQFDAAGKAMERALEDARPKDTKPNRKDCLFVFEELNEVESYWRTHDGSYLYEVEIDEDAVLHCGDMQLTDLIGAEFRKPIGVPDLDRVANLARTYWDGGRSTSPVLEWLVPSAKVVTELKGKSDMKAYVRSQITTYKSRGPPTIEDDE
jgi:hypothetical protein